MPRFDISVSHVTSPSNTILTYFLIVLMVILALNQQLILLLMPRMDIQVRVRMIVWGNIGDQTG